MMPQYKAVNANAPMQQPNMLFHAQTQLLQAAMPMIQPVTPNGADFAQGNVRQVLMSKLQPIINQGTINFIQQPQKIVLRQTLNILGNPPITR